MPGKRAQTVESPPMRLQEEEPRGKATRSRFPNFRTKTVSVIRLAVAAGSGGFAILAEKRGLQTSARGEKSLYFTAGLMEGTETIAFFVLMCVFPAAFAPLAGIFAALCLLTALARLRLAARMFG